jgi:hypothetical protein
MVASMGDQAVGIGASVDHGPTGDGVVLVPTPFPLELERDRAELMGKAAAERARWLGVEADRAPHEALGEVQPSPDPLGGLSLDARLQALEADGALAAKGLAFLLALGVEGEVAAPPTERAILPCVHGDNISDMR